MSDRKLSVARRIAKQKGINPMALNVSNKKGKRFSVTFNDGHVINFGSYPFNGQGTYIDHHDEKIREAWRARHSKIIKDGKPAYLNYLSPEWWSWNILW